MAPLKFDGQLKRFDITISRQAYKERYETWEDVYNPRQPPACMYLLGCCSVWGPSRLCGVRLGTSWEFGPASFQSVDRKSYGWTGVRRLIN